MDEYPALVITQDLSETYRNISNCGMVINICSNIQEVREFISKYRGVVSDLPIVLSDIARFYNHQSILLKFVEESSSPLLFISSQDCINSVLLSRFKSVVKYPVIVKNSKDNISLIKDKIVGETDSQPLSIDDIVRYAPSAYYILDIISHSNFPVKSKIKKLVF